MSAQPLPAIGEAPAETVQRVFESDSHTINFGPQHPAAHGVLRLVLEMKGEVVERAARRWMWRETQAEQMISERLDQVVEGTLSPYDVATEVLDSLKQGARL